MALIDLGELAEPTDPEPPRRRRPPSSRRLGAGLVALVALLALAGAVPPTARVYATLPGSLSSELILAEGQIFAVTPMPGVTDGSQELVAYPRPEHATVTPQRLAPLWRMPLPAGNHVFQVMPVADDAVLLSMALPVGQDSLETVLLDVRTGQQRWRAPGFATLDASNRALLHTRGQDEQITMRSVEVTSGRELWSTSLQAAAGLVYHERAGVIDAIVVPTSGGDLKVLDPETGAIRHRQPGLYDDELAGYQQASVVGDLVLMVRNSTTVTAYDLDGLVQRWQVTVPLAVFVASCGALLCVRTDDGGAHLLDPGTGAARWSSREDVEVVSVGKTRALAVTNGRRGDARGVVALDAATGEQLTDYGLWDLVASHDYLPHPLGVRRLPDVGLLLARLDPAEPRPVGVDVLVGATGDCQYRYDLIACRRRDGSFGVWQLRD